MATIRHSGPDRQASKKISPIVANTMALTGGEVLSAEAMFLERSAPKSLTGCVSAISSCAPLDHGYTDALKNYAEVYEEFQSYLSPLDVLSEHDYDRAIAMSMPENSHFGCINDDMIEFIAPIDTSVSDEDIESCGYLGWLHH